MLISKKTTYALRAVLELARPRHAGPVKTAVLADAQDIPPRFLEVILNQLKRAGLVASKRGAEGGFVLTRSPSVLTVGEVVRAVQGPSAPVEATATSGPGQRYGERAFGALWRRTQGAISDVLDGTTVGDLMEAERRLEYVADYCI